MIILTTITRTITFILIIQIIPKVRVTMNYIVHSNYGMEPNKIVDQGYKTLLPVQPSKSTSISVKHN